MRSAMKRSRKSTGPTRGASHVGFVLLQIDAATLAGEGGAAQFGGVPYSGGVVPNWGWHGDMAIDLASLQAIPGEVAALRDHDTSKIVGRAVLKNDGREIRIERGTFSTVTADAKEVSATLAEGHPWKLSLGIKGRFESLGQKRTVQLNGRSMEVETILRSGRILEFSFVPSGADPEAYAARLSALAGDQPPPTGENDMDELEQARARITELEAANATLTTERDTARTELAAANTKLADQAAARRNDRIKAVFGAKALEKDGGLTEVQLSAYRSMTEEQFEAVAATIPSAGSDSALFRQQAGGGRDPDKPTLGAEAYVAPSGYSVDDDRAQLHAKAVKYQAEHKTDYLTAVNAVSH